MTTCLFCARRLTRCVVVSAAFLVGTFLQPSPAWPESKLPRVPEGFVVEVAAEPPLVRYPMMACFDDRGRLYVGESAGLNLKADELLRRLPNSILRLEDTDGDGRFDRRTVFADRMTFPMGGVWYRGALYVASPPYIWRLQDTDDDGVADRREVLVGSFGFSGNAASVHGCFLGPCGRIYWCDGRHGHRFAEDGRTWSEGLAARIFSCRPDGTDVEVFCGGGLDNPVEVDFTPEGEMVGCANIFLSNPRVDCLVHWVDGGAYPRFDQPCVAEFKRTGDLLPPLARLGHVAVSGMTLYRSTVFGPEFQNNVFTTEFNIHKVVRSVLVRSGATFRSQEHDFLVSDDPDFHATDVLEDADGSLLVIDTGGWFRIGCPYSQVAKPEVLGAIYRVRRVDARPPEDPRGLRLRLEQRAAAELVRFLDDPRPVVRERAVDLLALQGADAVPVLQSVLESRAADVASESTDVENSPAKTAGGFSVEARRNAVWALARMQPPELGLAALRLALDDPAESVRLAAARAVGTNRLRGVEDRLCRMVVEDTPPVRRQAATALGRILEAGYRPRASRFRQRVREDELRRKTTAAPVSASKAGRPLRGKDNRDAQTVHAAVQSLFESVRKGVTDRFLEHALVYALIRMADRDATVPFLRDSNPDVRRAALVALDQMDGGNLTREMVAPLLDTDDQQLQKQALKIIAARPGWAGETLQLLSQWLRQSELSEEQAVVLRGFIAAQAGDPKIQRLVADALKRKDLPTATRVLLLEAIGRASVRPLPKAWLDALRDSLAYPDRAVRLQAVRNIRDRQLSQFDQQLLTLARSEVQPEELRVQALAAVVKRLERLADNDFQFLLLRATTFDQPLLQLAAARTLAAAPLTERQLLTLADSLNVAGPVVAPVLLRAFSPDGLSGGSSNGRATPAPPAPYSQKVGLALLEALKQSAVPYVSGDELERLLQVYPESVRRAAGPLLKQLGSDTTQRTARLQQLLPLLKGGDPDRGEEVFFSTKAACSKCHSVAGQGAAVGPDLTTIGAVRTGQDLLESVVFPSATFARGYRPYTVVTIDGRVVSGLITRETGDALYLRTSELDEIRISKSDVEIVKESNTSIMPKGLDQLLTPDELRDLLAYLQSLR